MTNKDAELGGAIPVHGEFDLVHIRGGRVVSRETVQNLVLNVGKEAIAKLVAGLHSNPISYIQIGQGDNAPAVTDTHLYAFYSEGLAAASYADGYKAVFSHTFQFSENATICEAGLADGVVAGSPKMFTRQTFAGRDVIPDDLLQITWRLTFG
jgi:hypothetical protein